MTFPVTPSVTSTAATPPVTPPTGESSFVMRRIRFGIPSLDSLIGKAGIQERKEKNKFFRVPGTENYDDKELSKYLNAQPLQADDLGIPLTKDAITICIAGTSGVGKSILALHLASRYAADTYHYKDCHVYYVSTDWSHSQALNVWKGFALDETKGVYGDAPKDISPQGNTQPFHIHGVEREPFWGLDDPIMPPYAYQKMDVAACKLSEVKPRNTPETLTSAEKNYDAATKTKYVHFIDLKSDTAGDDWQFINNLIGQLPVPDGEPDPMPDGEPGKKQGKHLLIIDAIEGLEAHSGHLDSYGNMRSRRSRITQLIRSAEGKCHLVFMVEGGVERDLPEQYAADVVLRLRNTVSQETQYMRRTIEVEKARGDAHVRGPHILQIRRNDRGSTTGAQMNMDDPETGHSYMYVVPGLDLVARETMWQRGTELPPPDVTKVADFGIRFLDDMLRMRDTTGMSNARYQSRDRGLPAGRVTALIGDSGTQKTRLLKAFAGRSFISYANKWEDENDAMAEKTSEAYLWISNFANQNPAPTIITSTDEQAFKNAIESQAKKDPLFTLFFTTQDVDNKELAEYAVKQTTRQGKRWENDFPSLSAEMIKALTKLFANAIMPFVICRRLERHYLSPGGLFHVFRQGLRYAQHHILMLQGLQQGLTKDEITKSKWIKDEYYITDKRKKEGHRIRVVIDDWQVIRDIYPEIRNDDQFLGFLLFYLSRQGVTTLIAQTLPGQLETIPDQSDSRLQKEASYQLRTWLARFGEVDKIAIAALPPIADDRNSVVRELKWERTKQDESLTVDPVLELYQGLREGHGRPHLTPLRVRLNAESQAMVSYARRMERLLHEKFPSEKAPDIHVLCSDSEPGGSLQAYENLRDLCHLQGDLPLNHSLVFMVDEFWVVPDEGANLQLGDLSEYLSQVTWERGRKQDKITDPEGLFQPDATLSDAQIADLNIVNRAVFFDIPPGAKADCVPFFQNFGFFLCREKVWAAAHNQELTVTRIDADTGQTVFYTVGDVWESLAKLSYSPKQFIKDELKTNYSTKEQCDKNQRDARPNVSWRLFLEASKVAASLWSSREAHVLPLDMSRHSMESLSCLVLEIWASEIYGDISDANEQKKFAQKLHGRSWTQNKTENFSLIHWLVGTDDANRSFEPTDIEAYRNRLGEGHSTDPNIKPAQQGCPGYSHALYRTLSLLSEVLTWETLTRTDNPFQEGGGTASPINAVSSRVWYTTASAQQGTLPAFRKPDQTGIPDFNEDDPLVMMAMPGRFSARGDWYLAIAPGSSSVRLGERALDLFSSFTNNVARLEAGIGLPARVGVPAFMGQGGSVSTREITKRYNSVRTPLMTFKHYHKSQVTPTNTAFNDFYPVPARYEDVIRLMPGTPSLQKSDTEAEEFFCLWRSKLYDYDKHARIFQKWILRELEFLIRLRQRQSAQWMNGFSFYDQQQTHYRNSLIHSNLLGQGGYFFNDNLDEKFGGQEYKDFDSWKRFCERSGDLLNALNGAMSRGD